MKTILTITILSICLNCNSQNNDYFFIGIKNSKSSNFNKNFIIIGNQLKFNKINWVTKFSVLSSKQNNQPIIVGSKIVNVYHKYFSNLFGNEYVSIKNVLKSDYIINFEPKYNFKIENGIKLYPSTIKLKNLFIKPFFSPQFEVEYYSTFKKYSFEYIPLEVYTDYEFFGNWEVHKYEENITQKTVPQNILIGLGSNIGFDIYYHKMYYSLNVGISKTLNNNLQNNENFDIYLGFNPNRILINYSFFIGFSF